MADQLNKKKSARTYCLQTALNLINIFIRHITKQHCSFITYKSVRFFLQDQYLASDVCLHFQNKRKRFSLYHISLVLNIFVYIVFFFFYNFTENLK